MSKAKANAMIAALLLIAPLLVVALLARLEPYGVEPKLPESKGLFENLTWLRVEGRYIVDEEGRAVVLRGANYGGLEFGTFVHREEDLARMAKWGFDVIRLPIAWAYIEPKPGYIDESYLKRIDQIIPWAKKYGIYVILDMHQWHWSKRYGGCGMPN